jgi:hypothetical protein
MITEIKLKKAVQLGATVDRIKVSDQKLIGLKMSITNLGAEVECSVLKDQVMCIPFEMIECWYKDKEEKAKLEPTIELKAEVKAEPKPEPKKGKANHK